jgi:hypothetical protein
MMQIRLCWERLHTLRERERGCKTLERILKLSRFCFCPSLFLGASYEKELMQQWQFCINLLGFDWFFFIGWNFCAGQSKFGEKNVVKSMA